MTSTETKHAEKLARESAALARKALRKSEELETYLSVLEYRAGKIRRHKSVAALFRELKRA